MKVDTEFHDIRTLPRYAETIAHAIRHPAIEREVVFARSETKLVRAVEIKDSTRFQPVIDLFHALLPVFDMFENGCGDDAVKTICADLRLLDVTDFQIEL